MTEAEQDELLDLYLDNALPETLRASVESHLAADPKAAADMAALQAAVLRLKAMPSERPDAWFADRTLDRLLHEHAAAQEPQITSRLSSEGRLS